MLSTGNIIGVKCDQLLDAKDVRGTQSALIPENRDGQ
jgi:hypothetical protein